MSIGVDYISSIKKQKLKEINKVIFELIKRIKLLEKEKQKIIKQKY